MKDGTADLKLGFSKVLFLLQRALWLGFGLLAGGLETSREALMERDAQRSAGIGQKGCLEKQLDRVNRQIHVYWEESSWLFFLCLR